MQPICPARITRKYFNAIYCSVNPFLYTLSLVLLSELAWQCIIQIVQINLSSQCPILIKNCLSTCLSELSSSVSIYLGVFQSWLCTLAFWTGPSCLLSDVFRICYLHYKTLPLYLIHNLPGYFDLRIIFWSNKAEQIFSALRHPLKQNLFVCLNEGNGWWKGHAA